MNRPNSKARAIYRARLIEVYGDVCAHCGQPQPGHIDHVIPVAVGGVRGYANTQLLCDACDTRKADNPDPYRIGRLSSEKWAQRTYARWALAHGILQERPLELVLKGDAA